MSELLIGTYAVLGMVGLSVSCWLYMAGGRSGKWKRRYVGSLVLATTVNLLMWVMGHWHWGFIALWPALALAFSQGYGGDVMWEKFVRRFIFMVGVCGSGVVCVLILGGNSWMLLIPHLGVGIWTVFLGLKNPIHAAAEEVFVCALLNLMLIAYPFIA